MTLYINQLDVTLTPERAAAVEAALTALVEALDFTVEVPAEDRKHLLKLGQRSEDFVAKAHELARERLEFLPKALRVEDLDRSAAVRNFLLSVEERLLPAVARVRDTKMLAGADLLQGCMVVYRSLRANGKSDELRALTEELGGRFAQKS